MTDTKDVRVVGFIDQNEEGDYTVEYVGDCDFGLLLASLERVEGVRFILNWPKRNTIKLTIVRPFEFLRNELDELFKIILNVKPKYYIAVD